MLVPARRLCGGDVVGKAEAQLVSRGDARGDSGAVWHERGRGEDGQRGGGGEREKEKEEEEEGEEAERD